ncbi:MAG: Xaa-Pro peptidase family protein [Alphaproteobacteria bacterium]|nr:Xaa-Pro peptidase family protein [Alphaproteobacteria bacterium]
MISRRSILGSATALALTPAFAKAVPADGVTIIAAQAKPIGAQERAARLAKVQRLMQQAGIGALIVEPGSSLVYFTGVEWWRSERLTAALIPAEGEVTIVTPFFEAPSIRESLGIPASVRTWNEHENPLALVADWLRERKLMNKPVAIEETVRLFIVDGLQKALPGVQTFNGAGIVRGCRMHKSMAEIALMKAAADITTSAFRAVGRQIQAGMTPADINALILAETAKHGGKGGEALVLIGEATAYPHGSHKPQIVSEGASILLDGGCSVHGYVSDISRSFVFGEPSKRQRDVWAQVRQGQQIAFEAAQLGRPCGSVDDAVRSWYEKIGYGPGYTLPGLSHRTGHGIGMDGHEPVNLVHGEATPLAPGMCFSNEPGLYIPGNFGIRLEDCFYMTEHGPEWFSVPPPSIDKPFS